MSLKQQIGFGVRVFIATAAAAAAAFYNFPAHVFGEQLVEAVFVVAHWELVVFGGGTENVKDLERGRRYEQCTRMSVAVQAVQEDVIHITSSTRGCHSQYKQY
jgi:hypothetical protein